MKGRRARWSVSRERVVQIEASTWLRHTSPVPPRPTSPSRRRCSVRVAWSATEVCTCCPVSLLRNASTLLGATTLTLGDVLTVKQAVCLRLHVVILCALLAVSWARGRRGVALVTWAAASRCDGGHHPQTDALHQKPVREDICDWCDSVARLGWMVRRCPWWPVALVSHVPVCWSCLSLPSRAALPFMFWKLLTVSHSRVSDSLQS